MNRVGIFFVAVFLLICIGFPLSSQIMVVGRLTHIREVAPGQTFSDVILVSNLDPEDAREVKVYQTDFAYTYDGKKYYGDPGSIVRSNADWITFSPERTSIPSNESVEIYYTIRVPDDASMKGTYWSILMVEGIPKGSPESGSEDDEEFSVGVMQVFRYAIQMVTNIGTTGTRQLQFLQIALHKNEEEGENTRFLQIDVANPGERWLRVGCLMELYDDLGAFIAKLEGEQRRLYPETSVRFNIDVAEVAAGSYKALIILDGGGEDVFGGMYTLVID